MAGKFDLQGELKKLREKGKKEEEISEWYSLASEIVQQISSKQLIPTMRTQYMRVAFQIPFDATVRVSLDTNLTMINERTKETLNGTRWYRDPNVDVPLNEITRFPHAVLEVKLQVKQGNESPQWVTDLINSGMLMEVHKFSKFIHGCAVLLPDEGTRRTGGHTTRLQRTFLTPFFVFCVLWGSPRRAVLDRRRVARPEHPPIRRWRPPPQGNNTPPCRTPSVSTAFPSPSPVPAHMFL